MDTQFWHNIELVVIPIIILIQIIFTAKAYSNISILKHIFKFKLLSRVGYIKKEKIGNSYFDERCFKKIADVDIVELPLVDFKGNHSKGNYRIIKRIRDAINNYLINNYGASVNFSIIKDIVDREVEVKDDEISQSITLPLYLGLGATMIGIILGLFSMPELDGDGFLKGVNALVYGVKIAMIGSLSGLLFTICLSSFFYKKARTIVQEGKNEQLTHLQVKLLPELIKAEDTGFSGLKASLDRFARVATNISDKELIASDKVLTATNQTTGNLKSQIVGVEKVDNMVRKVSEWNLVLFEKMGNNMEAFNNFSTYLSNMERITSQLLEFADKTSDVNKVINGIDSTLRASLKTGYSPDLFL